MSTKNEKMLIEEARRRVKGHEDFAKRYQTTATLDELYGTISRLADALEAATKPVTVNTVEELDALAVGSVVLWVSEEGDYIARKPTPVEYPHAVHGFWEIAGSELGTTTEAIRDDAHGAITVLHAPRQEGK